MPKFSEVSTIPRPNRCCQTRLTITRAASAPAGACQSVSQRASASRRPLVAPTARTADDVDADSSAARWNLPCTARSRSQARRRRPAFRDCRVRANASPAAGRRRRRLESCPKCVAWRPARRFAVRYLPVRPSRLRRAPRRFPARVTSSGALNFSARYFCTSLRLSAAVCSAVLTSARIGSGTVASLVSKNRCAMPVADGPSAAT